MSRESMLHKNFYAFVAAVLFCCPAWASTVKTSNGALAVELPSSWKNIAGEDDPDIVLDYKEGKTEIVLKSLNQELGDHYLQARLKDDINALRGRGYTLPGGIDSDKTHSGSTLYYTVYELGAKVIKTGYFTLAGKSYSLVATNVGEKDFEDILFTLRKQGEPAPVRVVAKPKKSSKHKDEEPEAAPMTIDENGNTTTLSTAPLSDAAAAPLAQAGTGQVALSSAAAPGAVSTATANVPAAPPAPVVLPKPYLDRSPLPLWIWGALLLLWYFAGKNAADAARRISYPKIAPLPKDVPPDFFFPFIVSRFVLPKELQYSITSRQQQKLAARFDRNYEGMMMDGIYGLVAFHVAWSAIVLTPFAAVIAGIVLPLPGGQFIASLPELPFLLMLGAACYNYFRTTFRLSVVDKEEKLVLEALPLSGTIMFRDGKGKEVGRLNRLKGRDWQLLDVDKDPVLELRDDHPELLAKRRLFGTQGGALRARYSIFVKDRRAGFVLNDPSSENKFQIHLEYGYSRLSHPTHIVMAVLYAASRDRDYPKPWFV